MVQEFVDASVRAIEAGLDGVELHAANGFLIDQFTRDSINQRDDKYGGTVDNRLRFMLEVVDAVCAAIGAGKVGIRLSPTNNVWGIKDSDPGNTFVRAVERLNTFNLAYVHILETKPDFESPEESKDYLTPLLREKYQGNLLINGGFDQLTGNDALENNEADAIAFGRPFISNPDLVERFQYEKPLTEANSTTFYTHHAEGYTDYPTMDMSR